MTRPLRVAFIGLHYAEYSLNLVKALSANCEVLAIFNHKNFQDEVGGSADLEYLGDVHFIFLPHIASMRIVFINAWKIISEIHKFKPDVIHCQENGKDYLIMALPYLRRYPFVLTIHDPRPHTGSDTKTRSSRYGKYLEFLRKSCDEVIVHGQYLRQQTQELLPRLIGHTHSILHGPLGNYVHSSPSGWEPGTLLFFGRIEAYKGLNYFIEAVRNLRNNGLDVLGVIAGRGHELELYRRDIESDPLFELHDGYVQKSVVSDLFRRANVVVLPYTDGTQSGVATLAIGQSRAVVASDVGSIPEIVRNGINGILVPPSDVEALTNALHQIVTDVSATQTMAVNAKNLALGELSWNILARQTEEVYLSALSTHRRRRAFS